MILNEEQLAIKNIAGDVAKKVIAPMAAHYDETEEFPWDNVKALADMGFTYALYLVGGSSYGWWRDKDGAIRELGIYNKESLPNINYLVFKKSH